MAGLCAPLSTLRRCPRGHLRMTRGRCGSLLLHRDGLAPSTPCRSPGALRSTPINRHRYRASACLKGARSGHFFQYESEPTIAAQTRALPVPLNRIAGREREMSAIWDLWSLSVAGPFTTGSVQMTKAELVTTAAGIPDDVVGAESLLISKGSKFDDQSASRTRTDRDSHHDRRVSHRLREGETSSQRKRPSWRKNQKEWQAQDPYDWEESRCLCRSEQRQGHLRYRRWNAG